MPSKPSDPSSQADRLKQLGDQRSTSFIGEFFQFIAENKKWWLAPIVLVLGLIGLLAVLSSTGAGPFIYSLF